MATKKSIPKPMPRPNLSLKQKFEQAQLDSVRNPNFDAAMAQKNYANFIAEQRARIQAERGTPTPPGGPLGGPVGLPSSKRDPSKEIVLNFAGGDFGVANDSAANDIAKRYNLEIVRRPFEGSRVPNYIFKSNGDTNNIISQIKNEKGIGYVEQNFVDKIQPVFEDKTIQPRPSDRFDDYRGQRPPQGPGGGMGGAIGGNYNRPPGGGMGGLASQQPGRLIEEPGMRIPQGQQQQMQNYQNLLQQGMQRSNAMNQDAATNFANLQAGAPTIPTTSTANIPAAGFGMQKPKAQTFKVQQGFPSVKAF